LTNAAAAKLAEVAGGRCACRACMASRDDRDASGWPLSLGLLIVCLTCGAWRCPRADHHDNACTGHNEPSTEGTEA
jgi:hypothetical protein